jgi:hypothetical protein
MGNSTCFIKNDLNIPLEVYVFNYADHINNTAWAKMTITLEPGETKKAEALPSYDGLKLVLVYDGRESGVYTASNESTVKCSAIKRANRGFSNFLDQAGVFMNENVRVN